MCVADRKKSVGRKERAWNPRNVERSGTQAQIIEAFWVGRGSHGDDEWYSWPERPGAD